METKADEDGGVPDPPANRDPDGDDSDFAEVDPTGRYGRYDEVLGKGAFKTVYRAFDEVDGIEVAWNQVKVQDVLQSSEDLERLYSEVHLLKTLKHKNIIKFYNSWVDTKTKNVNFITEIFTSGTLRQYRKRHKHVDIKAVKNWSRQILRGLLYLHSHDPPIIHRDLKCDNIFVNGNQGEVKIGDLGLAAILRQAHAAHSVIGTPEFMAPELYEEEYNELVDIYSFGMCLLEMVTFEYPYSECTNAAQIYKKVTSGKKPAALEKIKDPEVKAFVEKCLATASRRLPARELLMDPFLLCEGDREAIECVPSLSRCRSGADDMEELGVISEDHSYRLSATSGWKERLSESEVRGKGKVVAETEKLSNGSSKLIGGHVGDSEGEDDPLPERRQSVTTKGGKEDRPRRSRDFRVKGKRRDDDTIFLRLRIADPEGHIRNIHFPFDVEADTAMSVATEMLEELDLSDQDVTTIAEMIDAEILALVPEWKPGVACDDTGPLDAEASYDSRRESPVNAVGFPKARFDFDPMTTISSEGSLVDRLPVNRKLRSHSPRVGALTAGSPPRGEGTMHGRFEEITYHPRGSDHSWRHSDASPVFSSDLSDAQEGGSDVGGEHMSPESSSNAESSWQASRARGGGEFDQDSAGNISRPRDHAERSAFNDLVELRRNAGYSKYTHETWAGVALGSRGAGHSEDGDNDERQEQQEDDARSFTGRSASNSDADEGELADRELILLAIRQEQEIREMQWRHKQALRDLKARIHRKDTSAEELRSLRDSFGNTGVSASPERVVAHGIGRRHNHEAGSNGFLSADLGTASPSTHRGVYSKLFNGKKSTDESEESDRLSLKEIAAAIAEVKTVSDEGTCSPKVGCDGIVH